MLLYSRFKSVQRSLCFTVGLLGFSAAFSTQHVVGQQIQQTQPTQNPQFRIPQVPQQQPTAPTTRIYQSPIIRGPIYQGPTFHPQQGPVGPIYQAPQGTFQTVPPVAERLPQAVQPNQQLLNQAAEQAALDAEKISVLEKLLEKYKAAAAQGQGVPIELQSLKQKNAELMQEVENQKALVQKNAQTQTERITELRTLVEQTRRQYAQSETKVQMLEKEIAAAGTQNSPDMQKVKTLEAQVSDLNTKLQMVSGENKGYVQQLADSKVALKNAMESQPNENEKMELLQRTQRLTNQNKELTQKQEVFKQENNKLKEELTNTREKYEMVYSKQIEAQENNQKLRDQIVDLRASNSNITEITPIVDSGDPVPVATSFAQPSVDVSSYESKITHLSRKNRQLVDSNDNFKGEIKSLNRELGELKTRGNEVVTSEASTPLASSSVPAAGVTLPAIGEKKGGWGILGWLIPFLAIGLGVAFFVILKEEFQRPLATKTKHDRR